MRSHLTPKNKVKQTLTVLGTQGEYVVDVEKVDSKNVNLITMREIDEPPGTALSDTEVLSHQTKKTRAAD